MPLYEYKCNECGQVFEVMQRFSDSPLTQHEGCGGAVQRLLSAPALQFKGSGWYITDYSKSGAGNGKKEPGAPEKKTETKSDSGSSTPAAPASTTSGTSEKK
jgi:putative FmdB family regulatory protein